MMKIVLMIAASLVSSVLVLPTVSQAEASVVGTRVVAACGATELRV